MRQFVGEYKPRHYLLNPDEPMAVGAYATPVYYMEAKRQQAQAMLDAGADRIGASALVGLFQQEG